MQGAGRNIQKVSPTCIQAAAITGLMLLGMPSCGADGSVAPDVPLKSTQSRVEQSTVPIVGHADSHAKIAGSESLDTGKASEATKAASVGHKPAKNHAKTTLQGVNHDKSGSKAIKAVAKTFDMDVLIERLKKTDAIGMFSKLALRSDALDLMDMIKAYHKNIAKYSLKDLHARFNGLMLKVLALLDDDPGLSRDISLARENIWKSLLTPSHDKATRNIRRGDQSERRASAGIAVQEVKA